MHRDRDAWARPLDFEPGRWPRELGAAVPEAASLARHALAGMGHNGCFVPFGAGPRNCIGTGVALEARDSELSTGAAGIPAHLDACTIRPRLCIADGRQQTEQYCF